MSVSCVLPTSPISGLSGYSPFMGVPWGNTMPNYLSEAPAGAHLDIPESPMSPGEGPHTHGAPGSLLFPTPSVSFSVSWQEQHCSMSAAYLQKCLTMQVFAQVCPSACFLQ